MAYVCETCKDLEKDKYWDEVSPRKHKFFKIMLGNFESQLRIPRKFMRCFQGDLSHSCMLKGESENVWKVRLIESEEDVLFTNGWGSFVRDHNIEEGYFLVFCYVGDSTFEVSVFDSTGCENEGSYFTKKLNNLSFERSCRSTLHLDNKESRRTAAAVEGKGKGKGKEKVNEVVEIDSSGSEEEDSDYTSVQGFQGGLRSSSTSRTQRTQGKQIRKYYISNRCKVTKQEKEAASKRANVHMMSKSKSHRERMFKIIMLPSHVTVGFHLTIPQKWALKHLLRESHDIILRVPALKENWTVGCRWTTSQCQIRPGWSSFVLENNLEEHDVCLFELIEEEGTSAEKGNPEFNVHIFRVVNEVVPLTVSRGVF